VTFAGVIYVHDSKRDRVYESEIKTLRWLQCFCGPRFFDRITILTTKWDQFHPKAMRKELKRFNDNFVEFIPLLNHPPEPYRGCHFYHHGIPGGGALNESGDTLSVDDEDDKARRCEEAKKLIHNRYSGNMPPVEMQFEMERNTGVPVGNMPSVLALTAPATDGALEIVDGRVQLVFQRQRTPLQPEEPTETEEKEPQASFFADLFGVIQAAGNEPANWEFWFNVAKAVAVKLVSGKSMVQAWDRVTSWWGGLFSW
jgi:hypothetical protein